MNIYQCQEKAKEIGFDRARFVVVFPAGPKQCRWLDAYMGIFVIDEDGMRNGFVTTKQINETFPNLLCTEPYVEEVAHDH